MKSMEILASNQSRMSLRHCLVINFNGRRLSPCLAPYVEDVIALLSTIALGCNNLSTGLLVSGGM